MEGVLSINPKRGRLSSSNESLTTPNWLNLPIPPDYGTSLTRGVAATRLLLPLPSREFWGMMEANDFPSPGRQMPPPR